MIIGVKKDSTNADKKIKTASNKKYINNCFKNFSNFIFLDIIITKLYKK